MCEAAQYPRREIPSANGYFDDLTVRSFRTALIGIGCSSGTGRSAQSSSKKPSRIETGCRQRDNHVNGNLGGPNDRRQDSGSNKDGKNRELAPAHVRFFQFNAQPKFVFKAEIETFERLLPGRSSTPGVQSLRFAGRPVLRFLPFGF